MKLSFLSARVEKVTVWLDVGRTRARNLLKLLVEDGRVAETGTTKKKRYYIL